MATQATFRIWRGDPAGGKFQDLRHAGGRGHGGSGRRAPHPGSAGARSCRAMELQGRQVRLLFGRNQRNAEADVHDPAQQSQSRHAGDPRADARISRDSRPGYRRLVELPGQEDDQEIQAPFTRRCRMGRGACSRPTSNGCRSFASASSVFSARMCVTFCASTTSMTSSSDLVCWSMSPRSKCIPSTSRTA